MLYLKKVPKLLQNLFPHIIWRVNGTKKQVFLTFDDGPTPNITPFILNLLNEYQAKATFFCIGEQVKKYPQQFQMIIDGGHAVGNHTFSHPKGWQTNTENYLQDVARCAEVFQSQLFRPPYGQLTPKQYKTLKKQYKIVIWEIMNGDFSAETSSDDCLKTVTKNISAGSVIVLHDKERIAEKIKDYLPKLMEFLSKEGYEFGVL